MLHLNIQTQHKKILIIIILGIILFSNIGSADIGGIWPKIQNDKLQTGSSIYSTNTNGSVTIKNYTTCLGGGSDTSIVIDELDKIYLTCSQSLYQVNALGNENWHIDYSEAYTDSSTPVIDNQHIIYVRYGQKVSAIYPNGTYKWNHSFVDYIYSSLAINGNILYAGMNNNDFLAIYTENGSIYWTYTLPSPMYAQAVGIANDGTIYVGSYQSLFALNPNGTLKWQYNTASGSNVWSSPSIDSNGNIYFVVVPNMLYSVNSSGGFRWSYNIGGTTGGVYSSPSIDSNDIIYVGSKNYNLYSIFSNGSLNWIYSTSNRVESNPILDLNRNIYISSRFGNMYSIFPNGSLNWMYTAAGNTYGSFVINSNSNVYNFDYAGYLYIFNSQTSFSSEVNITCPIGWCYVAQNATSSTLLNLTNNQLNSTIQGHYLASGQKFELHRTGFQFNENKVINQKEGIVYYFTKLTNITISVPTTPSINLLTGWNLVANWGITPRNISQLKNSIATNYTSVKYYNSTTQTWETSNSSIIPAMASFFVNMSSSQYWSG